jgi:diguanylate cyclase (GGDEF)-like protein
MDRTLRVLVVDDSDADTRLMLYELRQRGYDPLYERVDTREAMASALDRQKWDLVIADYVMPHFSGLNALGLLRERGMDLPFIIVSGRIGEDVAVEAIKAGADDYIFKDNLTRLSFAVDRELQEAIARRERKRAEEDLLQTAAELQAVFQVLPDLYFRLGADGTILELLAGDPSDLYQPIEDLLGKRVQDVSKIMDLQFQQAIDQVRDARSMVRIEYNLSVRGEKQFFEACFLPLLADQIVVVIRNITEHKQTEERLIYLCYHDILTGIFNRSFFEEEIRRMKTKRQLPFSVIMGDVNGLKQVNDTLGHQVGDTLLIRTAGIFKSACRQEDIICRWGGDEFAILLPSTGRDTAGRICSQLRAASERTGREPLPVSFALGVATREDIDQPFELVLREAEDMMYQDKRRAACRN